MSYLKQIPLCVNVSTCKIVDPADGSEITTARSSLIPELHYGEQAVLCVSFVDANMNAVKLGDSEIFECSLDADYVHEANGVKDQLMASSGSSAVDIQGDWDSTSRANGKISIRMNCLTTGFQSKIGDEEKIEAALEIKCFSDGQYSVLCQSKIYACNVVKLDEDAPEDATQPFTKSAADSLYLKQISNASDVKDVAAARTNLEVDAAGTAATAVSTHNAASDAHSSLFAAKQAKITAAGLLKGDGAGGVSAAVAGTDYAAASHSHAASQISGLGDAATKNTGTASGTVAAGDDARINGAAQKANNLSDLADAATARTNLGLGSAATKDAGAAAGNLVELDANAKLPAVDGSQLTNLPAATSGNATSIQGKSVSSTAPANGQQLVYNATTLQYEPTTPSGTGDMTGPSSAVSGNVALFDGATGKALKDSGLTLSGSNTGDETQARIVSKLNASGDATISSAGAVTLASTGVTAGTVGSSTEVPVLTYDAKGRLTGVSKATISSAGGSLAYTEITASATQTATGLEYHYTGATAATLTLMAPPASTSQATDVYNDSSISLTISGTMKDDAGTRSTYALGAGCKIHLRSDGSYWKISPTQKMPNIGELASADYDRMLVVAPKSVSIFDSNTLAVCHFNGDIVDSTGNTTLTNNGTSPNSAISYTKFGSGSRYFNGSSYLAGTMPVLGTGDFTIEAWLYPTSLPADVTYFSTPGRTSDGLGLGCGGGRVVFYDGTTPLTINVSGVSAIGAYYHYCFMRKDGTLYAFVNGVLKASASWNRNVTETTYNLGRLLDNSNEYFSGYIDEFRISNTARYSTSGFTPQSAEFGPTTPAIAPSNYYWHQPSALPVINRTSSTAAAETLAIGNTYCYDSTVATTYTLTLPTPPATPCPPIHVVNNGGVAQTLSGAINGTASTTKSVAAGADALLKWDGAYWRTPDGSSADSGTAILYNSTSSTSQTELFLDGSATELSLPVSVSSTQRYFYTARITIMGTLCETPDGANAVANYCGGAVVYQAVFMAAPSVSLSTLAAWSSLNTTTGAAYLDGSAFAIAYGNGILTVKVTPATSYQSNWRAIVEWKRMKFLAEI